METAIAALSIDTYLLKKAAFVIRAINHPLRQKMLQLIHSRSKITVTEIYKELGLEQSVASQHLAILRLQGYVKTQRDGKCIFYSVNYGRLHEVEELCVELTRPKAGQ